MILTPEQLQMARKMCKEDFLSYCKFVKHDYDIHWHHEILGQKLIEVYEKIKKGERARLIIQIPPRHGKSETSTILFPTWILAKDPKFQVMTASYSQEMAEWFGMKARDVMQSESFKALSGVRLREDTQSKSKWLTQKNGGYLATGIGGSITGRGFNLGIIDDPIKNRDEAESLLIRNNIWDWFVSTFYTRQEGNAGIVVIMTRWHTDDLVGRLLAKEKEEREAGKENFDQWEVVSFPAIAQKDEEFRKEGEALWPKKFSLEMLETIKSTQGVYDFSSMYQQQPITSENQEFKKEYFKYFEDDDIASKDLEYTTTVDLALSKKENADDTVIMTVGKDRLSPRWYIVNITAGKFDPLETIDALFMHHKKYRGRVYIETVAYQKSLKYFIEEEQRRTGHFFLIDETKRQNRNKTEKIRGLLPLYRTGVIFHRKTHTKLEEQLMTFPFGTHDDYPDALAMHIEVIPPTAYQQPTTSFSSTEDLFSGI